MRCSEFLRRYSDLRDDLVTDECLRIRLDHHLLECGACRRYDAHVWRGVMVLRSTGMLNPSWRFRRRLASRLAAEACPEETSHRSRHSHHRLLAATLVAAAMILLAISATSSEPMVPGMTVAPAPAPPVAVRSDAYDLVVPAFGHWHTPTSADGPFVRPAVYSP